MRKAEAIEADLYASPDDETVNRAIQDYARAVREAYGARVKGIYLFGSRARGDHTPESDADVAVVLDDADWNFWKEKLRLANLSYPMIVDSGAHVQGWPVGERDWVDDNPKESPELFLAMRRDARPIGMSS